MRDADARNDVHPDALGSRMAPMTGNDDICFVDYDDANKAELADACRQQVDLTLWMLAGIMRIGLQIADRNIFDSTRFYGAADFIVDLFNLQNAITCGSLDVSTVIDTTEIGFRVALARFYGARTGDLRLGGRRVPKRRIDFRAGCLSFLDIYHRPTSFNEGTNRWTRRNSCVEIDPCRFL